TIRYGGRDRFETAATLATALDGQPTSAFLGTGSNFPDILSLAGPAAAREEPILLTNRDTLPQATLDYLNGSFGAKLKTIYIAGGEAVVGRAVADVLSARGLVLVRLEGSDRYATSAAIAEHFYGGGAQDQVTLATGQTFADGLAGAVNSAAVGAAVLLVQRDILPKSSWDYLERHASTLVDGFVYGGTAAVSRAVQNVAQTLIAP
ncbi:MAG: cell wall-binding repeat-containing protein, partial [Parcubacteria group bacterium]